MARFNLFRVVLLTLVAVASAQFGGSKRRQKPKSAVNKSDLKFIKCQVCEAMAKESRNIVKDLSEQAGAKKVSEADILERVEKMCNPDQNDGDWITMYDIVEQGTSLQLKDTGYIGKCMSECRTIAKACEDIAEEVDLTDLSAMLVKGKKRAAITNWMCYEAIDVCVKKPPPVPADRPTGERHIPLDEDEIRNIKMMRDMESMGLSGSLYNKDTMTEELTEMNDMYGDDPDFAQLLQDTGMGQYVPRNPGSNDDEEPQPASADESSSSSGGAAGATVAKLQETAAKAAETIKDGATKVVEGAKNLVGKLFGGNRAAEL